MPLAIITPLWVQWQGDDSASPHSEINILKDTMSDQLNPFLLYVGAAY